MRAGRRLALALVFAAAALSACAPKRLVLPSGDGEPFPDFAQAARQATEACRGVRSLSAELALAGRAGGEKIRGRATVGIAAPASIRLEGTAPFGPPVFILAADGTQATLLLPRDNRVASSETPAAILDALVGLDLGPTDLLAILAGCAVDDPQPTGGREFSGGWARLDLAGGGSLFLRRDDGQRWQVRAAVRPSLRLEYERGSGALPSAVRVIAGEGDRAQTDLRIGLAQVDVNTALAPEVFRVKVPADARPISLPELRQAGPMGEKR